MPDDGMQLENVVTGQGEQQRTPTTFKNVFASTSTNTAVWTPTAGKAFRILGFEINTSALATLAVAGETIVTLLDGAAQLFRFPIWLPATGFSPTVPTSIPVAPPRNFPGNGYKATAADNVLNIAMTTALSAGSMRVNVWGTEE